MLQIFNYKDKVGTVVAGSVVESGTLHTSGQERGVVQFRVKRKDDQGQWVNVVSDHSHGVLKRFKDTVHEVRTTVLSLSLSV